MLNKMNKQMTEDWIEQEYHRWKKMPCYNPFGLDEQMEWVAKAFALHVLEEAPSVHNTHLEDSR